MHKNVFTIACRGSWLSQAQAAIFTERIRQFFPDVTTKLLITETAGDKNLSTPLHLVEGTDFFTREIQDALRSGEADFALHSMKDVSSADFFSGSHYAIIAREAIQDVAVFNPNVAELIAKGQTLVLGTSSPRRSNMATAFLEKALPLTNGLSARIIATPVRGNVDGRLEKLAAGEYDGLVLAAAGLNRLLAFPSSATAVRQLLEGKKLMVLPLFECPPAAGQGAIVAETNASNTAAMDILRAIGDPVLTAAIQEERVYAEKYGYGCSRQFGVFHWAGKHTRFTYASGMDDDGEAFTEWNFTCPESLPDAHWFDTTMYMKDFFTYHYQSSAVPSGYKAYFIASHKAVHSRETERLLRLKRVWVAGTRTWYELAARGIWVEGSADGLGIESVQNLLQSPLIGLAQEAIHLLTNEFSAQRWANDGWLVSGTYTLIPLLTPAVRQEVSEADAIFWSSFQQYEICRHLLRPDVRHACAAGKTADLLKRENISPVVFPTIKAFQQWKKKHIPLPIEG